MTNALDEMVRGGEMFRRFFENATQAVFIADAASGLIVDVNQQGLALLGKSRPEVLGCHFTQLHPPADADKYRQLFALHAEKGCAADNDAEIIRKDGSIVPVMISASPITIDGHRLILGLFRDVSEHKRVERELGDSEQRYQDLANSLPEIVFETDNRGNLTFVNRNALRSFGYAKADLDRGLNAIQLLMPADRGMAEKRFQQVLCGRKSEPAEYRAQRKDGSTFTVLVYSRPIIRGGSLVGLRGLAIDITNQARLKQNMHLYIAEITRAQEEERKRIARELHDETLQALTMLSVEIKAMSQDRTRPPEEILRKLRQLGTRADNLVDEVRRLSKRLRPEVLDQLGLLPALEFLTGELNKTRHISARLEVTGTERRLSPDLELILYRVAQEALSNASKHSQATEVVVKLGYTPRKVEVDIADNGTGFEMPELLTDFARSGKLGLMGMRERVRLLNGEFLVKSTPGKGTTVTVAVTS